jgi:hypothetical protein
MLLKFGGETEIEKERFWGGREGKMHVYGRKPRLGWSHLPHLITYCGSADPQPHAGSAEPQPHTGSAEPQPQTGSAAPQDENASTMLKFSLIAISFASLAARTFAHLN